MNGNGAWPRRLLLLAACLLAPAAGCQREAERAPHTVASAPPAQQSPVAIEQAPVDGPAEFPAATTRPADPLPPIVVDIRSDGTAVVAGEAHDRPSLLRVLGTAARDQPDRHVFLRAQPKTPFNTFMKVYETVLAAGLRNIIIENAAPVDQPAAVMPPPPPTPLVINIHADGGSRVISGQAYDDDALVELLAGVAREEPARTVLIRADQQSLHKYFAAVARLCRKAGINEVKIRYVEP